MKKITFRVAAVGALAGLLATVSPLSAAFAATEPPTFPSGSAAPVYLVGGVDLVQVPKGTQLDWNADAQGGIKLSAVPVPNPIPEDGNFDPLAFPPATDGANKAITFISAPGDEMTKSKWKTWGDSNPLAGPGGGVFIPTVTPEYQGYGDSASVKATGGTYSLGVAYMKNNDLTVVTAYYTTINVDPGVGTWKFATPTAAAVATTTTVAVAPASPKVGDSVTLTATVAAASGTAVPTGTVTFKTGATTVGTGTLDATGTATFTTTGLAGGTHSIVASYSGDGSFSASTSAAANLTVAKIDTTVSLAVDKTSVEAGSDVILTATVTPATATGNVQFLDGATSLGTGSIFGGTATQTVTVASVGQRSYTAKFVANSSYNESTSAAVTVTGTAAEVALPPKAPSENALLDANRNGASASIDASNQATLSGLDPSLDGTTVNVFAYSTPAFLGQVTVTGGAVTVDASSLAAGSHKLVIADPATTNVLAWAPFNKTTDAAVPTITKTVNAEVQAQEPSDGEFSLIDTSGSSTVTLTNPTIVGGQSLSSGSLGNFKVTDLRQVSQPGWDLNTGVLDFTKGTDTIDKSALGIDPKLVSQAGTGATAPALSTKQDAGGASYPWTFAALDAGGFSGVTSYNADLTFLAPQGKPAGTYSSTLTLTLVSR